MATVAQAASVTARVPALSLDHVSHGYAPGAPVFRDASVAVRRGEVVALLGRSGCGKSTLMRVAAGHLTPWAGRVLADGRVINGPSPRRVLMLQAPTLYPWMTAADNAAVGLRFAGLPKAEARRRGHAMLERVGLPREAAQARVGDLSGGQQQRVALARALAVEPEVLLLDEPFSALDVFSRAALQDEVRRLAKDLGVAVLLVTHDVEEAAIMADRILVMAAGQAPRPVDLALPVPREDLLRLGDARTWLRAALAGPEHGAFYEI